MVLLQPYLSLLVTVFMDYLFPAFLFQHVCVFGSQVHLLQTAQSCIIFFIYYANMSLLIGEFNLFTFKVITDNKAPLSHANCFLYTFFVSHFLHYYLLMCLDDSKMFKFLTHFLLCIFYSYFLCGHQRRLYLTS